MPPDPPKGRFWYLSCLNLPKKIMLEKVTKTGAPSLTKILNRPTPLTYNSFKRLIYARFRSKLTLFKA